MRQRALRRASADATEPRPSVWRAFGLDAIRVGGAKVVGGVALISLNLWAARQLAPSTYGVFAVGLTVLLLVDSVFGSALDLGVLKTGPLQIRGADGLTAVERAAVVGKLLLAVSMIGLVASAGRWLSFLAFGTADEQLALMWVAIAGGGMLLLRSVQVHLQLTQRFDLYGTADVAHTAARVLLAGTVIAAGAASAASLLACYAVAALAVAGVFVVRDLTRRSSVAWIDLDACKELGRFVGIAVVTCGTGALVSRLDILILTFAGRPTEVGLFGVASTLALVPSLLGAYLSPIFAPRIVPLCRDGRFRAFYTTTQLTLWIAGAAVSLVGLLAAPLLIATMLPARYAPSIGIVRVLLPAGVAGFLIFPVTLHFLMFYAPKTFLALDALSLPLVIPAYVYAAHRDGAMGVAWVSAFSTVIKAVIAQIIAVRLAGAVDGNVDVQTARQRAASRAAGIGVAVEG